MNGENEKNKYITKANIEKLMEEQTGVILNAIDTVFDKRLKETNIQVGSRFESTNVRLDEIESGLGKKIDNVNILIDGYVKAQEDFKQEFVIMKEEFSKMKQIIKEKLGVEVKAI